MTHAPLLYIEDEEDYQMLVQRILGTAGLPVVVAETGHQGWDVLRRQRPALLILDINLPDTDGYALCKQLREDASWADLPILMLTVRRRPEEWLKAFSCGADDYVTKPLNPPELIERVQTCMDKRGKHQRTLGTPEHHLIQAAVGGNRAAFEILIQKYKERLVDSLRQVIRPAEAEDVVSNAFLRAYEKLDQFRSDSSFYTWLYRIAINESYHMRNEVVLVSLEALTQGDESAFLPVLTPSDGVDQSLSKEDHITKIQEAVAYVPRPYRQMLHWHFIRGASYEVIAHRFRIPVGTVMSRLFKAKQLLQQAWQIHQKGN